ncbi:hypothetical protein IAU59_002634 [Kwoniella sp. CBS 9459]
MRSREDPPPRIDVGTGAGATAHEWKYTKTFQVWTCPFRADADPSKVDESTSLSLALTAEVLEGQLWDVYAGKLSLVSVAHGSISDSGLDSGLPVVLKLMSPSDFPTRPGYDDDGRPDRYWYALHRHTSWTAKRCAIHEDFIYRSRLQMLWGSAVPYYYGMFRITRDEAGPDPKHPSQNSYIYAMILENAGESPDDPEHPYYMSITDRQAIYEAYEALHQAVVLHNSLGFRHAIKREAAGGEGDTAAVAMALVDFQRAEYLPSVSSKKRRKQFARQLREESSKIARWLGCVVDKDTNQLVSMVRRDLRKGVQQTLQASSNP